jgi:hypothetical protein
MKKLTVAISVKVIRTHRLAFHLIPAVCSLYRYHIGDNPKEKHVETFFALIAEGFPFVFTVRFHTSSLVINYTKCNGLNSEKNQFI